MKIIITTRLQKQLEKDSNLKQDFDQKKNDIEQYSFEQLKRLQGFGFKFYRGIDTNIGAIDFPNGKRMIVMLFSDYKNYNYKDNGFSTMSLDGTNHNEILICFKIAENHDRQQEVAENQEHRMQNNIVEEFIDISNNEEEQKNIKEIISDKTTTFKDIKYNEILTNTQYRELHKNNVGEHTLKLPKLLSGIAGSGKTIIIIQLIAELSKKINKENEIKKKQLVAKIEELKKDNLAYEIEINNRQISNKDRYEYKDIIDKNKEEIQYLENKKENINDKKILYVTLSAQLADDVAEKLKGYNFIDTEINRNINLNEKHNNLINITNFSSMCTKTIDSTKTIITEQLFKKEMDSNRYSQQERQFFTKNKNLVYAEIHGVLKGSMYNKWNRTKSCITEQDYQNNGNIRENYRIFFKKEDKTNIFSIAKKCFNQDTSKYISLNDISFDIINRIKNIDKYDYVFVDEVQDLTEVQIYLLYLLSKDKRNILFVGDPNQIINPTFFNESRITTLFLDEQQQRTTIGTSRLKDNFRNSKEIVPFINVLNDIRNEKLETRQAETRQDEVVANDNYGHFGFISNKNIDELLEKSKEKKWDIFVITSEQNKKNLEERGYKNIWTVEDIKGREGKNILVYNLLEDNKDIFNKIYSNNNRHRSKEYEFYFNQFYVAITRAQHNVYIVDNLELEIVKNLKKRLERLNIDGFIVKNINKIKMNDTISEEEYYDEGWKYIGTGEGYSLERAKNFFEQSKNTIQDYNKILKIINEFNNINNSFDMAQIAYDYALENMDNKDLSNKLLLLSQREYNKSGVYQNTDTNSEDFEKAVSIYLYLEKYEDFEKTNFNVLVFLDKKEKFKKIEDKIEKYLEYIQKQNNINIESMLENIKKNKEFIGRK